MWVTSDLSTDTDRLLLKKVAETNDKTNRTLAFEGILEPPQKIVQRSFASFTQPLTDTNNAMWSNLPDNKIEYWWLHEYTAVNAAKSYPVLLKLHRICMATLGWGYCDVWARVFQTEFILLWLSAARTKGMTYKKIWVIQDDVEFTGDPATFLLSRKFEKLDLISPHPSVRVSARHSARYIWTYPFVGQPGKNNAAHKELFFSGEGIRGYSSEFLAALQNEAVLGHSAWSEFAAPTLCNHMSSICKQGNFERSDFSARWEWEDQTDCALTSTELEKKLEPWFQSLSSVWKDVWVHKVTDAGLPKRMPGLCRLIKKRTHHNASHQKRISTHIKNASPNVTSELSNKFAVLPAEVEVLVQCLALLVTLLGVFMLFRRICASSLPKSKRFSFMPFPKRRKYDDHKV